MATPDDCPMVDFADTNVIAEGFVLGFRRIVEDDELFDQASRKLFERLSGHTIDGTRRWIGSKILAGIGMGLLGAGLYLVGRFGR